MTNYELMFVIDAALDEEKRAAVIETVKEIITADGSVGEVKEWGVRKLAYEINDFKEGYYVDLEFESDSNEALLEYDRVCNIKDSIIRHIVVKLPR